jgi:rhodanese-related sulfurtransferase
VLLDARSPEEYQSGHIAGSLNLPLQAWNRAEEMIPDKDVPVFVYCHSGARSSEAVSMLREMGYTHAMNIGGICSYLGRVERGGRRSARRMASAD